MDAGLISSVVTVVFFVLFIAILVWAFYSGNKKKFEDAGNLPFQEDADEARKPD
jgi:cytochrome c oxidase cbb3-type subunit 4